MKYYLGVDLGGTHVRVAKVDENGTVLEQIKRESYGKEGPAKVVPNIVDMIKSIDGYKDCVGVGIGIPGPAVNGVMMMCTNLPGFDNFQFDKAIEEGTGLKCFVENDANVAGIAEALAGAGKGYKYVYYITHSTGIGGAMIIDGKVIPGAHGYAGEVGDIIVRGGVNKINHMNAGAVEMLAAGPKVSAEMAKYMNKPCPGGKEFFEFVKEGSQEALAVRDQMCVDIATMMSSVGLVLDPDCFVIGGGMSNGSDLYFDKLEEEYKKRVHTGLMQDCKILKATLDEPGVVGAAMLVKSYLG